MPAEAPTQDAHALDYSIHYSRWHDDSPEHAQAQADRCDKLFGTYLPPASDNYVLDVGCGMGFAMRMLKQRGFTQVEGIDISPQQIAACQKHGLNASLEADTLDFLESRPDRYEVILLLDVLEHIPLSMQVVTLRAIYNALRPGGRLVLTTPNATSIVAYRWRNIDYTHVTSFTELSLDFLLRNALFKNIRIDSSDPANSLKSYLRPWRLWKALTNRSERRQFKLSLVRWVWKQILSAEFPDNTWRLPLGRNLHAVAYKP